MSLTVSRPRLPHLGGALLLVGLVLMLGFLTQLPNAHAWLHQTPRLSHGPCQHPDPAPLKTAVPASHDDVGCAITLFAQGLPAPDLAPRALPPRILADTTVSPSPERSAPRVPARLHPPAHAPPTLG